MSASRKMSFVYHERKVRDEKEIQSLLFDDDEDDEGEDGEGPCKGRWVVQKSSKSPFRKAVISLTRCGVVSPSSKTKENGKVPPLKIKRKLSYAVDKVETPKKRPDIVYTIDLLTSEEDSDETSTKCDEKRFKNGRRSVKNKESKNVLTMKEAKTSEFKVEYLTPCIIEIQEFICFHTITTTIVTVASIDDYYDGLIKKVASSSKTDDRQTPRKKTKIKPHDDAENKILTPSKTLQKPLSDEEKNETEETKKDCTPSKRRKPKTDCNGGGPYLGLPLSPRIMPNLLLPRVVLTLDKITVSSLPESPTKTREDLVVFGAEKIKTTPSKQTPSKSEPLKSAVAVSKADTTPIKGITPGKEAKVSSNVTPCKGNIPLKSPAKPSQAVSSSEDEDEPSKPSRPSKAKKAVISSEDEEEPAKPSGPSRTRKTVTSREDEEEPAKPSRPSKTRKSQASPLIKSMIESPTRSLRQRDHLQKMLTPRRSARFSMSPSTPSLRQKVLLANTPRSSLPPLKDEDESEDEFITPRKTPKSAKKKLDLTPATPLSTRKVGHGFLSPVVADRDGRAPTTPSSALGIARSENIPVSMRNRRAQLHVSTLPTSLPCREKEFNDIKSFIYRKIQDGTGGCMYISGVPGTGKTATVHTVVRTLQKMAEDDEMPQFDFVEVNGLRMTEPRQAYVRIWEIISKNKVTADQALKHLETKFLGKPKRCTVLLVDELDYLCNRRQDVIYNILDWTTKRYSKFIVLTIANTMDLPERTLKGKVTSRMGLTRLVFQPYTYEQLEKIVLNRLDGCKAFHADAVQLVARKVAAVSGDARRALDICRRSTEILELEGRSAVSILDIQKVLTQIFAGSRVQAIKNCSLMAKLVLRAIRDEVLRTGVEETTVAYIHPQLVSICALEGKREPSVTNILTICSNLADSGLIFAEKERKDINRKISLNISTDDIHYAIDC